MSRALSQQDEDFTGSVALITGGAGDIGLAVARRLASKGVAVALADVRAPALEAALRRVGRVAEVITHCAELTDDAAAAQVVQATEQRLGPIRFLVNAMGKIDMRPFGEIAPAEWQEVINVNLIGPVNIIRAVLPSMIMRGRGAIVNVCSIWASRGGSSRSSYIAAKHGLLGVTKALAEEFEDSGVSITAVSPGPVDTAMSRPFGSAAQRADWLRADDVAALVCFACGSAAWSLSGSEIQAFRGRTSPGKVGNAAVEP